MRHTASRAWASRAIVALVALAGGCGGEDGGGGGADGGGAAQGREKLAEGTAESPRPFIEQFERVTGVRLKPVRGDIFGTRLEVPSKPNRFERFGAYSLIWTRDDRRREQFLGRGEPDDDGIHWRSVGGSYSASKPFGDRLVLRWVGRREKETNSQWDRLERAVEASLDGDLDPLHEEERPCRNEGLDPLEGRTGECSLRGLPVTFVEADDDLSTDALEAEVLGFGYADVLRNPGVAPLRPRGRFLIVAYRLKNESEAPINFVHPGLRVGARTIPESPDAAALLPRSRALPLPPGATIEARAAFDVDQGVDPRRAALVLPAEREGTRDPSPLLAQGWIRLEKAPAKLPRARGGRGSAAGQP